MGWAMLTRKQARLRTRAAGIVHRASYALDSPDRRDVLGAILNDQPRQALVGIIAAEAELRKARAALEEWQRCR